MQQFERITFANDPENPVKIVESNGKQTLTGYAVVWGAVSTPRADGKRYQFDRGSIEWGKEVQAYWHHQPAAILGNTANQTLSVTEDDHGARVEMALPDTTTGRDVFSLVRDGYVKGMSFGGIIREAKATNQHGIYRVGKFAAHEVTVTPSPAMVETTIAVLTDEAPAAANEKPEMVDKLKKVDQHRQEKNKLERLKLAAMKPGKVSG